MNPEGPLRVQFRARIDAISTMRPARPRVRL